MMGINLSVLFLLHFLCKMFTVDPAGLAMIVPTPTKDDPIIYQKFGEMQEMPGEEEDDGDYCPSEADSEDSLEWASETEQTMAEDDLAEGNVGINYTDAAVSMTTEYLASFKPVQMGLGAASILPLLSVQRAARAAKRAGAKNMDGFSSSPAMVITAVNSILSYFGIQLTSGIEDSSKPHLEPGTEPFSPEQEFGEMTLTDYDSDEDADYDPVDSEEDSEEEDLLEFNSDASVSSEEEAGALSDE